MAPTSSKAGLDDFFHDLVRCETRLYNALGDELRAEHGIVTSQYEFLRYLREHPGARVADVATTYAVGIGAVSKMVDRLVARGWAERLPNPVDKRSSLISLTAAGTALADAAEATFRDRLAALVLPAVGAAGVADAAAVLAVLRVALERDRVGLPAG